MTSDQSRIAVLETKQEHYEARMEKMSAQVDEMHAVLLQAKGAKWAILGVASLAGFFAGKMAGLFALFGAKM